MNYDSADFKLMLLRPLPLYKKGAIKKRRYWQNVLGVSEEKLNELIKSGWFK
jgi:hypothetical protein